MPPSVSTVTPPSVSIVTPSSVSTVTPPSVSTVTPPSVSTVTPPSVSTVTPPQSVYAVHTTYSPMKTDQDTFKSTLVKTLLKVFPVDPTLQKYDMLRNKAKQPKSLNVCEQKQLFALSQRLKTSLVLKYRELNCSINNSECTHAGGRKGSFRNRVHSSQNNSEAVHKLNIHVVKRVLKHEWKLDIDALL